MVDAEHMFEGTSHATFRALTAGTRWNNEHVPGYSYLYRGLCAPTSLCCFALLAPSPLGKVKALEIMMLQLAPVECRPRSALMHWESLRGLGMSLGDVVAVWAEETVATPLLLSVWASGAVAVGRVGLSEEARAALGPVSRIRLSVVGAAVSGDASLVELVALSAAQEDDLGLWRWHGTDGSLSARLLGAHVRAGCVVALRLHGAAAVLRVVRARGPKARFRAWVLRSAWVLARK